MRGNNTTAVPNATTSWINLSPSESDEFGVPRAYVHLKLTAGDVQVWQAMDQTALALAQKSPGARQYRISSTMADGKRSRSRSTGRFPNGIAGSGRPITNRERCGWATRPRTP